DRRGTPSKQGRSLRRSAPLRPNGGTPRLRRGGRPRRALRGTRANRGSQARTRTRAQTHRSSSGPIRAAPSQLPTPPTSHPTPPTPTPPPPPPPSRREPGLRELRRGASFG